MKVLAKCHNYAGCLLAYRGEEIELAPGAPLVCPECGKPVTIVKSAGGALKKFIPIVIGLAVLAGVIIVIAPLISNTLKDPEKPSSEQPSSTEPGKTGNTEPGTTSPSTQGSQVSEPPATVKAPEKIDLNLGKAENQKVKEEVLKRIDLMPNVTAANKDKLYNSVERARSMGKVLTIPFGSGKMTLGAAEIQALKDELEKPEIAKLRDDPTSVFVILGYADPKGDQKKNITISQARADVVLEAMRDKAGVSNVMHSVAMGGSTIMDEKNLEKNRIVEVWAVLP
jgi:outer membrane protein OmpA-like peptidoglycan-associated protein